MNNILSLTKLYFKTSIMSVISKGSKKGIKTDNKKNLTTALLVLLLGGYVVFTLYSMFLNFAGLLNDVGKVQYVLMLGLIYFNIIVVMMFSLQLQGFFFKNKDFDLIASMPIKNYEIVISRLISIMLISYVFEAIIFVPAIVSFFMVAGLSINLLLFLVLSFFLIPVFIISLSIIIVFAINFISSRVKNKSLVNIAFMFVFTILILLGSFYLSYSFIQDIAGLAEMPLLIKVLLPTVYLFMNAVESLTIANVLIFVVANLAVLAITVYLISLIYFKVNHKYANRSKTKTQKPLVYKQQSVTKTLLKQEFKHFSNLPTYVINALIGVIMLLLLGVGASIMIYRTPEITDIIDALDKNIVLASVIGAYTMFVAMSNTSNVSISIEGKMLQVKKSMPITVQQIFYSKILLNIIVVLPFAIASLIALTPGMIVLGFNVFDVLLIMLAIIIVSVFNAVYGLMINLLFPKLDWQNEAALVKQSISVVITMLTSLAISAAYFALLFALNVNGIIFAMVFLIAIVFTTPAILWFVFTKGQQMFAKLN